MRIEEEPPEFPARVPVSPELVARASELVKRFPGCFWFWHTEARVQTREDIELVIKNLREYGDKQAWKEAQELRKCL